MSGPSTTPPRRISELSAGQAALAAATQQIAQPLIERAGVVLFVPGVDGFVASGVLVEHDGNLWIATAAHVAQAALAADARIGWAPSGREANYIDVRLRDVAVAWGAADDADIAAILLKDAVRNVFSLAHFVPSKQCAIDLDPVEISDIVWLAGSPLAQRTRVRQERELPEAQVFVAVTTHVRPDCAAESAHGEDECGDFPRAAVGDYHVDWSELSEGGGPYLPAFRAGGMSGSPLWSAAIDTGVLWNAESLRVVAVAWYENPNTHCIRATPFGHWYRAAGVALSKLLTP